MAFIHDRWGESTFNKLWACHCHWQPCRGDTGCFSFPWVHTSDQAECTQARPAIFPACPLYKVLTPKRLWSFTLEEFFHQKWRGRRKKRFRKRMTDFWVSRDVYMCGMTDSENAGAMPLKQGRANKKKKVIQCLMDVTISPDFFIRRRRPKMQCTVCVHLMKVRLWVIHPNQMEISFAFMTILLLKHSPKHQTSTGFPKDGHLFWSVPIKIVDMLLFTPIKLVFCLFI